MQQIKHLLFLFPATICLIGAFVRAWFFYPKKALQQLNLAPDKALTKAEKKRFKHYYFGVTFLSTVFCCLRGETRNSREKHLFANLTALACYFDDLSEQVDNAAFTSQNPEDYGLKRDSNGKAMYFLNNIYDGIKQAHLIIFKQYMQYVFNIETNKNTPLSVHSSLKHAQEKGGYSILMFRSLLFNPLSDAEILALYHFGALMQCSDDIFDVWFDIQNNITTVATLHCEQGKINALKNLFESQVFTTKSAIDATTFHWFNKETTIRIIHFIAAITRVCLNNYSNLAQKNGTLPLANRQQMVVDMAKWSNKFKTMVYVLTITGRTTRF